MLRFAGAAARLVLAAFATFAFSAVAEAQFLTFVAATGVDTRPCTVQAQPCKTLQRAVTVTGAGGIIRILSDLPAQSATIAKSLTVEGGGNSMIGTININSASAVVALRNLALTGRGAVATGIRITSAAAVHIEDCTIERYTGDGIKLSASTATELFVSDTVSRDNGDNGLLVSDNNAHVTIDNSRFENNSESGLRLWVANANVTETTAADNTYHGYYLVAGSFATLISSVARGNGFAGLVVEDDPSPASAVISNSVFTNNGTGIDNRGTLYTFANNTNLSNGTDYSGSLGIKTTVSPGF